MHALFASAGAVGEVAEWLKAHSAPLARISPERMRAPSRRRRGGRGGRVVEGARLESVYTGNRIAGSNPALSASPSKQFVLRRSQTANNRPVPRAFPERAPYLGDS